jgi:hypothetical protein
VLRDAKLVRVAEDIGGKLSFHDCTLLLTRKGRAPYILRCVAEIVPFSNSNSQFKPTGIIMSAIARNRMKNWEVIADNLKKAGWSLGYVSAVDPQGRTIWIADAHHDDGKRFVVRADEKLTAFIEP